MAPKVHGIEDEDNINGGIDEITLVNGTISDEEDTLEDLLEEEEVKMTLDELISGALESAFWAMDKLILKGLTKIRSQTPSDSNQPQVTPSNPN